MHALAAHVAFDGQRGVDDGLHVLFGLVGLLEVGVRGQRLVDGDAQLVADHLAQAVAHAVRVAQHAGGVANGVFRLQLAERDDAGNVVFAIDVFDVLDDLLTTLILEVDVDIGHLDALGRQESLEQQAVGQRVEVGNAHRVCHDGACGRTAARSYADALAAGPFDIFLHDEEVCRESLLDDDAHLVVGTFLPLVGHGVAVTLDQALLDALAKPALLRLAVGQREARQNRIALQFDVAFLGQLHRVVARLGEITQRGAHLFLGLHIELVVGEAHAVLVIHIGAGADAQHDVLGAGVVLRQVMEVVGGDSLEAQLVGDLGQLDVHIVLGHAAVGRDALVLQLDVEVAGLEKIGELAGPCACAIEIACVDAARDNAGDAGR